VENIAQALTLLTLIFSMKFSISLGRLFMCLEQPKNNISKGSFIGVDSTTSRALLKRVEAISSAIILVLPLFEW
jgi:hypothetical protein